MNLTDKTTEELIALRRAIEDEPKNRTKGLWMFSKSARKKLDEIDRAIAHNIREQRIASGRLVDDSGYSGRQTNRR